MQIFGVRVYDREAKRLSNLHDECYKWIREYAEAQGVNSMQRFTEMGPATTNPDAICDLFACRLPLSQDAEPPRAF